MNMEAKIAQILERETEIVVKRDLKRLLKNLGRLKATED